MFLDDYINKNAKGTLWEVVEFHIMQYSVDCQNYRR